jgi:hypothetical protein
MPDNEGKESQLPSTGIGKGRMGLVQGKEKPQINNKNP